MAKLWGGRFTKGTDKAVEDFTSSIAFDARMYAEDIRPAAGRAGSSGWRPRRLPDPTARRQLHSLLPAVFLVCLR